MNIQDRKNWQVFRIIGWSVVILSTLLLLWVVVDTFSYLFVPWQHAGFDEFLLDKESTFWIQYSGHCSFFDAKWITRIVWHFSWLFSLIGILIIAKFGQNSEEKYSESPISLNHVNNTPEIGKLSYDTLHPYVNTFHLILLIIGTYAVRIKKGIFFSSGDPIWENIAFFLIIFPLFSIFPQFFLSKIIARRSIQKVKYKRDYAFILLLLTGLFLSFFLFGITRCA